MAFLPFQMLAAGKGGGKTSSKASRTQRLMRFLTLMVLVWSYMINAQTTATTPAPSRAPTPGGTPSPPASADSDVYNQGDLVLANPVEATVVFLTVILISAILEFFIDTASDVENKYFRVMFAALSQEVMIIGVLVLLLSFAETVHDWPDRWILIFKWSMMCLFLMIISFVIMILILLAVVTFSDRGWRKFEAEKMDSGAALSSREKQYKHSATKFQTALQAFGYDSSQGILFSVYISKLQRRNVVSLTDLTWVSWVCLATLVILNAIRAEITRRASEFTDENIEDAMSVNQRVGNYMSFIFFIGYLTLGIFLIMYWRLNVRLNEYLGLDKDDIQRQAPQLASRGGKRRGGLDEPLAGQDALDDSRVYLFRRSQQATLEMLQVIILCFEWYLAAFFLSYAYQIVINLGGLSAPIMICAVIPIVIFVFLCPWAITMITVLGNLGNNLQESLVQGQLIKSGIAEEELPGRKRKLKKQQEEEEAARRRAGTLTEGSIDLNGTFTSLPGGMNLASTAAPTTSMSREMDTLNPSSFVNPTYRPPNR